MHHCANLVGESSDLTMTSEGWRVPTKRVKSTRTKTRAGNRQFVGNNEFEAIAGQNRDKKTRQDKTRQDKTRQDKTRQDKTRQDKTRQDKTRQDRTRQDRSIVRFDCDGDARASREGCEKETQGIHRTGVKVGQKTRKDARRTRTSWGF